MNSNTEGQQAKQRAQQFEQQAQQAKQGEQKAQSMTAQNTQNAQMSNLNGPSVAGAGIPLESVKFEIAKEVGIPNYDQIDRGNLTARQNGIIGGQMTKGLAQMPELGILNNK